ncbi:hypothetical protein [Serratia marcescens]|uniref:hypothetical protein n=1 Tax=Serratia marcescens TaxID=615 RepID=UPI0012D2FEAC|nr:hypothetical protein [Serratia marcescens]
MQTIILPDNPMALSIFYRIYTTPVNSTKYQENTMFKKLLLLAFAATVSHSAVAQSSDPLMQIDYTKFRYSFNEMYRIANPSLLQHRTLYAAPSTGPDAAWFDAVKQGNLALVKTIMASIEGPQRLDLPL